MADIDGLTASDAQGDPNRIISDDGDPASSRASGNSFEDKLLEFEEVASSDAELKPWFVAVILVFAVLAVSSAGAVTKSMVGAAPITNAGWRLQVTSFILLPGFLWQWFRLPVLTSDRSLQTINISILGFSGFALALHFGLWVSICHSTTQTSGLKEFIQDQVWSLDHTSLPHSLLFVSTPPIILALLAFCQGKPLSRGELVGVALGVGGMVIIVGGSHLENDNDVTFLGDLGAFAASVAFVVYISAGQHLRGWMPLYVYAFPVTAIGACLLAVGGIVLEGLSLSSSGKICGPFGWVRKEFWLPTLYLALGPGFVGHTGLNAVLRYTSSLVIAMAVTLEPPLGTAVGWILHVTPPPGIWTCVGGAVLLLGTLWVNYAGEKVQKDSKISTSNDSNTQTDECRHLLEP